MFATELLKVFFTRFRKFHSMLALKMLVGVGRVGVTEKGGNEAHRSSYERG